MRFIDKKVVGKRKDLTKSKYATFCRGGGRDDVVPLLILADDGSDNKVTVEVSKEVTKCMGPKALEYFYYYYIYGWTSEYIGRRFNKSGNGIRTSIARANRKIDAYLEGENFKRNAFSKTFEQSSNSKEESDSEPVDEAIQRLWDEKERLQKRIKEYERIIEENPDDPRRGVLQKKIVSYNSSIKSIFDQLILSGAKAPTKGRVDKNWNFRYNTALDSFYDSGYILSTDIKGKSFDTEYDHDKRQNYSDPLLDQLDDELSDEHISMEKYYQWLAKIWPLLTKFQIQCVHCYYNLGLDGPHTAIKLRGSCSHSNQTIVYDTLKRALYTIRRWIKVYRLIDKCSINGKFDLVNFIIETEILTPGQKFYSLIRLALPEVSCYRIAKAESFGTIKQYKNRETTISDSIKSANKIFDFLGIKDLPILYTPRLTWDETTTRQSMLDELGIEEWKS